MPNLFNPDYLQHLCKKYGLRPSKRYGQNFLIHPVKSGKAGLPSAEFNRVNPEPIEKMIESAELSSEDIVVEVGPGFGVLTFALAEKVKKVYAFEIEKKIKEYWDEKIKKYPNVKIVWGNVLKQLETFLSADRHDNLPARNALACEAGGKLACPNDWTRSVGRATYKVIANLPYQITSPVIRFFLEADNKPDLMVLMVQKEVAERICAKPGKMSLLSIAVQYYADPEIITIAPRSFFWPMPKVDSAIVKLTINKEPLRQAQDKQLANKENEKDFFRIVKAGFANRRKILIKNLESLVGKKNRLKLERIFVDLGLNPKIRAQELSVEDWKRLAERIEKLKNPKPNF